MDAIRQCPTPVLFAAAFAAGLLAALGFAPLFMWLMTVAGVTVVLILLVLRPRHGPGIGWWFGFGMFLFSLTWIATAFSYQTTMPAVLGWVAVAGLAAYLALFPMAAGWATGRLAGGHGLATIVLAAGFFVLAELARGALFTGFPWNPLGEGLLDAGPLAALAAVIGAPGLAAVVVLLAGGVAVIGRRGGLRLFYIAAVGGILGASVFVLDGRTPPKATPVTLLVVQPNVTMTERLAPGGEDLMLQRLAWMTRPALAEGPPVDAVVWPEGAINYPLADEPELRRGLGGLLQGKQLLFAGTVSFHRGGNGAIDGAYNSIVALDERGDLVGRYDKAHLVPGGEYLPLRPIAEKLGLARLVPGDIDFLPGPGPRTLRLPGLPAVGPDICYEIVFPAAIVDRAARPRWILTVSNDAWFGRFGPPQHFAQARLRAIEEGLPVVRGTVNGVSGVIDARGHVVTAMALGQSGVLRAVLPGAFPQTVFGRFGLVVPLLLAVFLVGLGVAVRVLLPGAADIFRYAGGKI